MLSKKMAVSLTSLIIIFAFAFVAPAVMAQDFDVKFDAHDISFAGDIQIDRSETVVVYVNFGKVVTLADVRSAFPSNTAANNASTSSTVDILNYHGAVIDIAGNIVVVDDREVDTRLTVGEANRVQAGKDYTITITIPTEQRPGDGEALDKNDDAYRLRLFLPEGAIVEADRNAGKKSKKGFSDKIFLVGPEPATLADRSPKPFSIALPPGLLIPDAGFTGDSFDIIVTLTEQPKENKLTKDHFDVAEGAAADAVYLGAVAPMDGPPGAYSEAETDDTDADTATGRDMMFHRYLVKITPAKKDATLVAKLKSFGDQEIYTRADSATGAINGSGPNEWDPPVSDLDRIEGIDKLTVKLKNAVAVDKKEGLRVALPKDKVIPAGGYLIVAESKGGSQIIAPATDDDKSPDTTKDAGPQLRYKIIENDKIPNLESFLLTGGIIDVESPQNLAITEVMWGSDASLADPADNQWIELYNAGGEYKTQDGDNTTYLVFYRPNEALAPRASVKDRIGTIDANGVPWSIVGKGQNGRTGTGETVPDTIAVTPTQPVISMYRMTTAGVLADGRMADSWMSSKPPGLNFNREAVGVRTGSPGAVPIAFPERPAPEPEPTPAPVVPVADAMDIMITEIMVDTGSGRLPQWIELTNVSGAAKSLAGWSLMITNAAADADVIGETVSINLSGTLGVGGGEDAGGTMGKSLLLVGGTARSSSNLAGSDRVVDISSQVAQRGRYAFISSIGFMAALIPPQMTGVLAYGDTAGNLGADEAWEIPMDDSGRSSLIRREMLADGMATMGTDANGWVLASDTPLVSGPATWYGSDEDAGTPGYDSGGPLPVELSHFRPARDKATGAVVITWATQSELNNAGFFIKRSNQRNGQFEVVNPTMIPGAGTTSEKQTYTYTDTTAQPNIVYYYQIEDVSLDGNRQTLTNGIRLKGHIGAAGKLTSTWGEIKASNE